MPGLHAKKSPSGAKRLHRCAGALTLIDSLPIEMRSSSGVASKLGTCTHFLLEAALRAGKPPASWADRLIKIVNEGTDEEDCVFLPPKAKIPRGVEAANVFLVDVDMIANADLAYDYVERRCNDLGLPLSSLQLETRTNPVPDREDTSGTADVTIDAWPEVLELVDYKNGRIVVEHEDNEQVLAYLAGKAHDLGWDYVEYKLTIVQPNGRHEEGKTRTVTVPKEKLLAFVDKHRAACEAADEAADNWTGSPGDYVEVSKESDPATWGEVYLHAGPHCLDSFCDAAHGNVCPAFQLYKQREAKEADWDSPPPNAEDPNPILVETVADAEDIMARAGFMRRLIGRANAFLLNEAKAGRTPPGMKFVRKRGYRKWKPGEDGETVPPPSMIAQSLVDQGFISDNERARLFKPESLLTGPQVEKLLIPSKRRKEFSELFLYKPEGGLKLVPVTAPGEAVPYSVGDDFEDDEEGDEL
jgi:hypothetical protein